MKLTNKLFAGLTAFSMLAMVLAPAANVSVHADNVEDANAYEWARDYGLTSMPTFGAFRFEDGITRQEAAKFLVAGAEALEISLESDQRCAGYADLDDANPTLTPYIQEGCELGIFKDQLNFNPFQALTREQAELTVARIWYGFDAVNDYAEDNNLVDFAAARELLMQDGIVTKDIPGQSTVVRGHLLLMLYRLADVDHDTNGDDNGPVKPGSAEISRVSSAGTQDVPMNVRNAKVGTVKIAAGSNGASVSAVELAVEGLFANSSINSNTSVMLKSPTVASRTANFASTTKKANVRFSPALQLAAGESHTFDVYASLSGTDNENFSFKIIGVNVANGTASGTPISLGTLKTTSALSDEYDLKVKNNYTSLKAGDKNETIAQVEFTPQNDTAKLESFVLKFAYTNSSNRYYADEVFENVKVYDGDNVVGSAAVSKDKVIVSGLNISKDRKKTAKLTIKADVIHAGDDINYGFEVVADDTIVTKAGASYGLRENNVTTPATANGKVEGYGAEFKKVAISPKEYAPEKSDVVLYHATYKAATDTYIDDFQLKRSNGYTHGSADYDKLFEDHSYILTVAGQEYTYNSSDIAGDPSESGEEIYIPAGLLVDITLTADTEDYSSVAGANPNKVKFDFEITNLLDGDDNVVAYNKTVAGDTITIKAGTAEVRNSNKAAPLSKTLYSNDTFEIGRFAIKTETEDLTLNEFTAEFTYVGTGSNPATDLADLLNNDDNIVTLETLDGTDLGADVTLNGDDIAFKNINHTLTADKTENFVVKVELGNVKDSSGTTVKLHEIRGVNVERGTDSVNVDDHTPTNNTYTVGIKPPLVNVSRYSDNKFLVTVKNVDDEDDITALQEIDVRVRPTVADADFNQNGSICLINNVNISSCANADLGNASGSIGPVVTIDLTSDGISLDSGEEVEFYILVDANVTEPEILEGSVSRVQYDSTEEFYSVKSND